MQYAVDILDGLRRQAGLIGLIRCQRIVKGLHSMGQEVFHPDRAQSRLDMYPDVTFVNLFCTRLAGTQVVFHPDVQPLAQRHPTRLLIGTVVDFYCQRL